MSSDTIYAVATGHAQSAIAIVRISGPKSIEAVSRLTKERIPEPRTLARRALVASDDAVIDDAMVVVFPEGASYTGESMAELHCHGGVAVVSAVLAELSDRNGLRVAEPGEFTLRAVLNGRIDLPEAEGIGDLIAAETELQRRQAMRVMSGAISDQADRWRLVLVEARALLELTIDWADEEVPEDVTDDVRVLLDGLDQELGVELSRTSRAEKLRSGFEVAIVGAPNVGKSSLLNALAGREAAITSDVPGTTRDVIELRYDLDGVPVVFLDLAGLRETSDPVEQIGVDRAIERARSADLRLFLSSNDVSALDDICGLRAEFDLDVWTKSDLVRGEGDASVSSKDGSGMDELLRLISERLPSGMSDLGVFNHHRQIVAVEECRSLVQSCLRSLGESDLELVAEDLRRACVELERVVGRIDVEDVLGSVFSSFCLGK